MRKFLTTEKGGVVELLQTWLDLVHSLQCPGWPRPLVTATARVYTAWRRHWATLLDFSSPADPLTRDCSRRFLLGTECLLSGV